MSLVLTVAVVTWSLGVATAQKPEDNGNMKGQSKVADKLKWVAARKAAAARIKEERLQVGKTAPLAASLATDAQGHLIPDYFGAANWAFSPPLTKFVDPLPSLSVSRSGCCYLSGIRATTRSRCSGSRSR